MEDDETVGDSIKCPWCGHVVDDSWDYSSGDQECPSCEQPIHVEVQQSVTYTTTKRVESKPDTEDMRQCDGCLEWFPRKELTETWDLDLFCSDCRDEEDEG